MRSVLFVLVLSMTLLVLAVHWALSADLHITIDTNPPGPVEVAIVGEHAATPSAITALTFVSLLRTVIVPQADIDALHTDYVCVTARAKGTQTWWTHPDGTYSCRLWPTAIPIPTPPPPPPTVTLQQALQAGIDKCLKDKNRTNLKCFQGLSDALKKVTP